MPRPYGSRFTVHDSRFTGALRDLLLLDVDVVADDAAEDRARGAPDDGTLHTALRDHAAEDGAGAGADGGITLGVLVDLLARGRRRGRRGAAARGAAGRSTRGGAA